MDNDFKLKQIKALNQLIVMQKEIANLSVSLEKLYPVVIVKENVFYVFDFEEDNMSYEYKCECQSPINISESIMAAFDLEFYDHRMAAVINEKALDTIEGYIFTFHEFVHCYQAENSESELKATLKLANKSIREGNYMWELTYEFPYDNKKFIELSANYEIFYRNKGLDNLKNYYDELKNELDEFSYEYMIWQQWKEGYARYIENLIRKHFGCGINSTLIEPPYTRGSFYEMGSRYIELLLKNDKSSVTNIKDLYHKMFLTTESSSFVRE